MGALLLLVLVVVLEPHNPDSRLARYRSPSNGGADGERLTLMCDCTGKQTPPMPPNAAAARINSSSQNGSFVPPS